MNPKDSNDSNNSNDPNEPVFQGLRVLDIGSFIAAPAAATVLADFGAHVIKVEPPKGGDPFRALSFMPGYPVSQENYCWSLDSRNKRSLALNLTTPEGQEVLQRLARDADVVITNTPLATRARLGMDYAQLSANNKRVIYASLTAYGETGPEAHMTGFDSTAWWARSGLMDQVRSDSDTTPARSSPGMGDHMSAMTLFGAIATALYRRERTGAGSYVSSSLIANGAWANGCLLQAGLSGAQFNRRPPRTEAKIPLSNHYQCQDGRWLILSMSVSPVQEDRTWATFAGIVGRPEWVQDPRFATRDARKQHHRELVAGLDECFMARAARQWRDLLSEAGIACGVVARSQDVVDDEQMKAAGVVVPMPQGAGASHTVSSPFQIAESPKVPVVKAPDLGEHTLAVLQELGYPPQEIEAMRAAGIIA